MTEPSPNKRGRPKKVESVVNPDCLPATRGYAKYLVRHGNKHTHANRLSTGYIAIGLIVGYATTFIVLIWGVYSPVAEATLASWFPALALFSLGMTLVAFDYSDSLHMNVGEADFTEEGVVSKWVPARDDRECE